MRYVDPQGSLVGDGCTAYMRYENALRALETLTGSIVGVDGGVDAVRRTLYQPMHPEQLPDLVLPLCVVEQGYRVVFAPDAILEEETLSTPSAEYHMRVRVALRAFWALRDKRGLLNPLRYPLFSWQLAVAQAAALHEFPAAGGGGRAELGTAGTRLGVQRPGGAAVLCVAACAPGRRRPGAAARASDRRATAITFCCSTGLPQWHLPASCVARNRCSGNRAPGEIACQ